VAIAAPPPVLTLGAHEPLAEAITAAIQTGDLVELERLLAENPQLATARIIRRDRCGEQSRWPLHIATDWPGHFPNAKETVRAPHRCRSGRQRPFAGEHGETPLHWAASSGRRRGARRPSGSSG